MIGCLLIFAVLLFALGTDPVNALWPHLAFRASACVLAAVYLSVGVFRKNLRGSWCALALALPAVWGLVQLSLYSTVWRLATWQATLQWVAYLTLFVAASQQIALRSHLRVAAWFGGAFGCYAIAQYLAWNRPGEPMMATFFNQNHYAAFIELLFPIALWRIFRDREKPVLVLCALAMVASVAMSGSRAGLILVIVELLYLGLRATRKPLPVLGGVLLIGAISVALTWNRFEKLTTADPYESRTATARASLKMAQDKPQFGYGLGTWANVYPAYAERDTGFRLIHADDDWLEWTAEGGVPFTVIMLIIAAFAIRAAWQEPWAAGCVAVLLHSFVEFPMQKQALWAWFVVILAVAQTGRKPERARWKQAS